MKSPYVYQLICDHCGAPFERNHDNIGRGSRRNRHAYCTPACGNKARTLPVDIANVHKMVRDCLKTAKQRVKVKQLEHTLTNDEADTMWLAQGGKCAATGVDISFLNPNPILRPSLDRRDNARGYTADNVHFVCRGYNYLKLTYTTEQALEALKKIAESLDANKR